jgi:hypothetical protein
VIHVMVGRRESPGASNPAFKQTPGGLGGSERVGVVRHASARGVCSTSQVQLNLNVRQ